VGGRKKKKKKQASKAKASDDKANASKAKQAKEQKQKTKEQKNKTKEKKQKTKAKAKRKPKKNDGDDSGDADVSEEDDKCDSDSATRSDGDGDSDSDTSDSDSECDSDGEPLCSVYGIRSYAVVRKKSEYLIQWEGERWKAEEHWMWVKASQLQRSQKLVKDFHRLNPQTSKCTKDTKFTPVFVKMSDADIRSEYAENMEAEYKKKHGPNAKVTDHMLYCWHDEAFSKTLKPRNEKK